jgi:hypothetical protein
MARHRRALVGAPVYLVVLLLGLRVWGARGAAAVILLGNVAYGFLPTILAFARVVSVHRARVRAAASDAEPDAIGDAPPCLQCSDPDGDDDRVDAPAAVADAPALVTNR